MLVSVLLESNEDFFFSDGHVGGGFDNFRPTESKIYLLKGFYGQYPAQVRIIMATTKIRSMNIKKPMSFFRILSFLLSHLPHC
jgi:hypothetical protein